MASQLLSTRREFGCVSPLRNGLHFFHSLEMEARGAHPLLTTAAEQMEVLVTIYHGDIHRVLRQPNPSQPPTALTDEEQEVEANCLSFVPGIPSHLLSSSAWSEEVFRMLMSFDIYPDTRLRVLQALPSFLTHAARKAREEGFGALLVQARVLQQVRDLAVAAAPPTPTTTGSDDGTLSVAAMERRAIRTVQFKGEGLCVVCLDEFSDGMEVSELRCSHVFHSGCIIPWLHVRHRHQQPSTCPICRKEIFPPHSYN